MDAKLFQSKHLRDVKILLKNKKANSNVHCCCIIYLTFILAYTLNVNMLASIMAPDELLFQLLYLLPINM